MCFYVHRAYYCASYPIHAFLGLKTHLWLLVTLTDALGWQCSQSVDDDKMLIHANGRSNSGGGYSGHPYLEDTQTRSRVSCLPQQTSGKTFVQGQESCRYCSVRILMHMVRAKMISPM
jgi:hypothetical protein